MLKIVGLVSLVATLCGSSQAQLSINPRLVSSSSFVTPGSVVEVAFDVTGVGAHNSAIFRVAWSVPGMTLLSYQWSAPYDTGGLFDDSRPVLTLLPAVITPNLVAGFGYPEGVCDIELSNVIPPGRASFLTGEIARLSFRVDPSLPQSTFSLSVIPDTFALGSQVRAVEAGPAIGFFVIPSAGSVQALVVGCMLSSRRRRRA